MIELLVGPNAESFNLHKERLEKGTCFFICHPDAGRRVDNPDQNDQPARQIAPHPYHLRGTRDGAFRVLAEWLYFPRTESKVALPTNPDSLRSLLDAYLLATRYRAQGLPDLIMDSVRQYIRGKVVRFDLLDYAMEQHASELDQQQDRTQHGPTLPLDRPENCKIIIYLIHQILWDIATRGIEKYETHNRGLEAFLGQENHGLKMRLIRELARLARDGKGPDPATPEGLKAIYYVETRQAPAAREVVEIHEAEEDHEPAGRPNRRRKRE